MREDNLEEGGRWLEQATVDLHWVEELAKRGGYYLACFLAQQVAEKALKGFLYGRGLEIVLGHSVERLSQEAVEREPTIEGSSGYRVGNRVLFYLPRTRWHWWRCVGSSRTVCTGSPSS